MTDSAEAAGSGVSPGARESGAVAMPREAWQEAVIESITQDTPTVRRFRLRPRVWRPFLAGQHVIVRLTAPDGYTAQRSYSVTSSPHDTGALELAIERLDDGEVSPYFHEVAQPGDVVELRGPFATHFAWLAAPDEPVLLVGGGSGVAPFMSMVRYRASLPTPPPMVLVYSARSWNDVIFREELLRHEREQEGLSLVFCLTRAAAGGAAIPDGLDATTMARDLVFGRRVDRDILERAMARLPAAPALAFVCGRNSFVDAVATTLVALGVPATNIRTERYGGS